MIKKIFYFLIISFFLPNMLLGKSEYFKDGVNLYNKNKFEDAKFKFEQDIVFNPKANCHICIYLKYLINKKKQI